MWTRAPPFTSDHSVVPSCLALDQEAEVCKLEALSPRLHHNHQPGEQEQLEYCTVSTKHTSALDYYYPFSSQRTTLVHHDLPEAAGSFKRLPTEGFFAKNSFSKLSHMSTPESTNVLARRVRHQLQLFPETNISYYTHHLVGCMSATECRQLDDMQTRIVNAKHTLLNASSDQEVPELVVPSKRRRVVLATHDEFIISKDSSHSVDPACEDHSGVTADQHMADLDSNSKASTPEDIDSQVPASLATAAKPDQLAAAPQYSYSSPSGKQQVVEQETHKRNVESQCRSQVMLEQPRQLDLHPSNDDTESAPQIHIWVPRSRSSLSRYPSKTMASHGSEEWLQLSLGTGVQSGETQPADQVPQTINPPAGTDPSQRIIRDFFKFGSETEAHYGITNTSSPIMPRHRQQYSDTPESSHRSSGALSKPLSFLEPRPPSSRDSTRVDPNVIIPRVPSGINVENVEGQFLSPSQRTPAFSNFITLPYHPARVLQPVGSEQTETTSVHVSPWMGMGVHHPHYEAPRTPPNPAELICMATPGAFRDWRPGAAGSPGPYLTMQPHPAQGVDPEQAWRNLLQRVGSNVNVLSGVKGAGASSSLGHGEAMMLPSSEREEYLDALTRAVERFQGADQGGKDEPLTELQRLQRNAMFPPGQRPHPGPFDPITDVSLARYLNTPSSSGSKARASAPASSSDRQRRILRPHAPRPGLWFTLQAANSQSEASPLQQIPTAYIRVVDDNMTVAAVRRYLVNKLGLASEDEVEFTCKGRPLQPSIPLSQVRDGIWQSPSINTPNLSTPQLLSEGKAWKAPDGSITLVGDVVMVLTYGRRPQTPPRASLDMALHTHMNTSLFSEQ
ncbi:hypothetical protein M758_UG106600 [Ceratodon purpureus]|nr:hypothetical protein M758_UG106600 [Ceratodon purpureus]